MVALILTLVLAFLVGGTAWLSIGSRLKLNPEGDINEVLNLIVYVGIALAPVFVVVFYLLDRN